MARPSLLSLIGTVGHRRKRPFDESSAVLMILLSGMTSDKYPATAGSILRASTSAEVANVFSGLEHHDRRCLSCFRDFAAYFFEVSFYPAHAGNFNLAILGNPKNRGHVRQPVCIGYGIFSGIVEEQGKRHPKFFTEGSGLL